MKWIPAELARFARDAGFQGEDVTTAVAVALATSGGIDTYDFRAGSPGAGHWQGLWGVDVDRWPAYAWADLHVPQHCALAAFELCDQFAGWEWSPVWRAGAHEPHAGTAADARSREYDRQQPAHTMTIGQNGRKIRAAIDRMAALRIMLADYHHPRG